MKEPVTVISIGSFSIVISSPVSGLIIFLDSKARLEGVKSLIFNPLNFIRLNRSVVILFKDDFLGILLIISSKSLFKICQFVLSPTILLLNFLFREKNI